jgi:putative acetyltransferase
VTLVYRELDRGEAALAADIHRRAGAVMPDYDTSLHTAAEYVDFYRDVVFKDCMVVGAFDGETLVAVMATRAGWIDHLYVEPSRHGEGIGSALVRLAQREQAELRLYTFQSNLRARALYERHGFVVEELTDGSRNEEKMPDVTYYWRRTE